MINISKVYLLPLMMESLGVNNEFVHLIENTWANSDIEEGNLFFIKYIFSENKNFIEYEGRIIKNKLFIKMYNFNNFVIYAFTFPEEYLKEYFLYKKGKYSLFGKDAKFLIIEFWRKSLPNIFTSKKVLKKIKGILFKSNDLKEEIEEKLDVRLSNDAELGEAYNEEKETLSIGKLYKKEKDFINNFK